MFQAALTSRALGMHQRVIVTEDSEGLTPPPTRRKQTTLRDIIEAREAVLVEGKKYGRGVIVTYKRPYNEFWVKVEGYNDVIKLAQSESGMLTSFGRHPSGASWQAFQVVKKFIKAGYPQIKPHGQWPEKMNEEKQPKGTVKPGSSKPGSGKPGQYASKGKFSMAEMIDGIETATALDEAEPKLGSGQRFKKLAGELEKKGAKDPKALAAWIGRKKYGSKKFGKLSAQGRSESECTGDEDCGCGCKQ